MAKIEIDMKEIERLAKEFDQVRKQQIPYALRLTANKLAENTKLHMETKQIPSLDRPTRYALNMMRVDYARSNKNPVATVKVKDTAMVTKRGMFGPDQVLGHLFTGGQRRGKGFEGLMQQAGILPKGMYAVPGEGVTLDGYGNMPRGLIVQLLAYFRAFQESGFRANMTTKSRAAFGRRHRRKNYQSAQSFNFFLIRVGDKSRLHPGIWSRVGFSVGKSIKPILMFVNKAVYRRYFDLPSIADMIIERDLEFVFNQSLNHAIATSFWRRYSRRPSPEG
ncbi:hypothetical protein ABO04_05065 [Nitrosomonas sp. HPC101]|uniref:hypothetical protein n=1 Tax=Nitrosomonas sp. HPC101 TaxID=1658667 RepID=UPI0013693045|nr:hypothetical protein [Nitrosomonas sp. HPC101]MXS85305.1 hypothetical protein [Nitrosomonas sp. HPC101]